MTDDSDAILGLNAAAAVAAAEEVAQSGDAFITDNSEKELDESGPQDAATVERHSTESALDGIQDCNQDVDDHESSVIAAAVVAATAASACENDHEDATTPATEPQPGAEASVPEEPNNDKKRKSCDNDHTSTTIPATSSSPPVAIHTATDTAIDSQDFVADDMEVAAQGAAASAVNPPSETAGETATSFLPPNATEASDTVAAGNTGISSNKRARSGPTRVSWDDRMASLLAYKAEHGDLNIPIRYKLNPSLGKFVHNTREQYKLFHGRVKPGYQKSCSLTPDRIAQLDGMGFLWTTERVKKQNEDWNGRLEQLKEFKAKHGDCLVPHGYSEDPSFAEWIHRQRTAYASMLKVKTPNAMVKDRMDKLAEMGFNFTVHTDKWMEHWCQLKAYKEKHGNCQVPTHFGENPRLGRWTHTQRHQRRLMDRDRKSCMTQERIDLLDQLGFTWKVRPAMEQSRATWQQRFDELKRFFLENGHFLISSESHPKLHVWSHEQRSRLLNMHLSGKDASRRMGPDRVQTLEGLGFTKDTPLLDLCSVLPGVGDDDLLAPVLEHFAMDVDEVSSPQPPAPLMAPAFEDLSEEPIADAPITDVPPDTVNEALTGQNADEALEVNNQDNVHDSTQASAAAPIAEDEIATADEMQV